MDPRAVTVVTETREYDKDGALVAQSGYSGPVERRPARPEGCVCPSCGAWCVCDHHDDDTGAVH